MFLYRDDNFTNNVYLVFPFPDGAALILVRETPPTLRHSLRVSFIRYYIKPVLPIASPSGFVFCGHRPRLRITIVFWP